MIALFPETFHMEAHKKRGKSFREGKSLFTEVEY